MRIALLSAGPSLLAAADPGADCQIRIGVNTAASLHACDWWSCADAHRIEEIDPIGSPRLFTMGPEYDKALARCSDKAKRFEVLLWDQVFHETGASPKWQNWSATSALVLGKWLGATAIDCYGVDMAGVTCCAGGVMAPERRPQRWERERALWRTIVKWLSKQGTQVIIHADGVLHPDQVA